MNNNGFSSVDQIISKGSLVRKRKIERMLYYLSLVYNDPSISDAIIEKFIFDIVESCHNYAEWFIANKRFSHAYGFLELSYLLLTGEFSWINVSNNSSGEKIKRYSKEENLRNIMKIFFCTEKLKDESTLNENKFSFSVSIPDIESIQVPDYEHVEGARKSLIRHISETLEFTSNKLFTQDNSVYKNILNDTGNNRVKPDTEKNNDIRIQRRILKDGSFSAVVIAFQKHTLFLIKKLELKRQFYMNHSSLNGFFPEVFNSDEIFSLNNIISMTKDAKNSILSTDACLKVVKIPCGIKYNNYCKNSRKLSCSRILYRNFKYYANNSILIIINLVNKHDLCIPGVVSFCCSACRVNVGNSLVEQNVDRSSALISQLVNPKRKKYTFRKENIKAAKPAWEKVKLHRKIVLVHFCQICGKRIVGFGLKLQKYDKNCEIPASFSVPKTLVKQPFALGGKGKNSVAYGIIGISLEEEQYWKNRNNYRSLKSEFDFSRNLKSSFKKTKKIDENNNKLISTNDSSYLTESESILVKSLKLAFSKDIKKHSIGNFSSRSFLSNPLNYLLNQSDKIKTVFLKSDLEYKQESNLPASPNYRYFIESEVSEAPCSGKEMTVELPQFSNLYSPRSFYYRVFDKFRNYKKDLEFDSCESFTCNSDFFKTSERCLSENEKFPPSASDFFFHETFSAVTWDSIFTDTVEKTRNFVLPTLRSSVKNVAATRIRRQEPSYKETAEFFSTSSQANKNKKPSLQTVQSDEKLNTRNLLARFEKDIKFVLSCNEKNVTTNKITLCDEESFSDSINPISVNTQFKNSLSMTKRENLRLVEEPLPQSNCKEEKSIYGRHNNTFLLNEYVNFDEVDNILDVIKKRYATLNTTSDNELSDNKLLDLVFEEQREADKNIKNSYKSKKLKDMLIPKPPVAVEKEMACYSRKYCF